MLHLLPNVSVPNLIAAYGLWIVFGLIFLESTGIPLPGETALVSAALYAGSTQHFSLASIIAVAFAAAVTGDTMGYFVGRTVGLRALTKYGKHVHITANRLKIGEYLFFRHGGKIVFFGRFIALLRTLAAFLAGANRMPWPRFALMNSLGGLCWVSIFAGGAYYFGQGIKTVEGPIAVAILAVFIIAIVSGIMFMRRYEEQLLVKANAVLSRRNLL